MPQRSRHLQQELLRSPTGRAALTAIGVAVAGTLLRQKPGSAGLIGLAAGAVVRETGTGMARIERETRNAHDTAVLATRLGPGIPPLGGWAIEADFGELIAREIHGGAETVVELGSGVSTLLAARMLGRTAKGRLVSVEHHAEYLAQTRDTLERDGLEDVVELVLAPLADQTFRGVTTEWYDVAPIVEGLDGRLIDLVVVDGPPSVRGDARWPVVEALRPYMSERVVILLDDGRAARESATAERWAVENSDLQLFWHDTVKGSWRLQRAPGPETRTVTRLRRMIRRVNPRPSGFGRWAVRRS
jgi:hypothetical protein